MIGALDWFRLAAAFLVAAIHISPLEGVSVWGDLVLTRVVGRGAVPFFFMVTGFFVLGEGRWERVQASLSKNLRWYLAAILLYLPVNWYAGKLAGLSLGAAVRELAFGGTFYHLWYLPAVLAGLPLSWGLLRRLGRRGALLAAGGLYLAGVLGDSYYGLAARIPALEAVYSGLFAVMENTRNGIFMAPLFLLLGQEIAQRRRSENTRGSALNGRGEEAFGGAPGKGLLFWGLCLAAGLAVMTAEGLWVHMAGWPRHDSMYAALPAVMVFLFELLVRAPVKERPALRAVSLWFYLLHPLCIVAVRAFAGVTGTEAFLVGNRLAHYVCVTGVSLGASYIASSFIDTGKRRRRVPSIWVKPEDEAQTPWEDEKEEEDRMDEKQNREPMGGRAWVETDLAALTENVNQFRQVLSRGCRLMAVMKADAYGHGAIPVALHLQGLGVTDFAVATAAEGISLRQAGVRGNILILGYTSPQEWPEVYENDLIQTIVDEEYAVAMNRFGCANGALRAHLALDTGMHRLGVSAGDMEAVREIFLLPAIRIEGVFSHLCVAGSREESDVEYTRQQLKRFEAMRGYIEKLCIQLNRGAGDEGAKLCFHIQNSFGLLNYPQLEYDLARMGIALYGAYETKEDRPQLELGLLPVMSVRARVAMVRTVEPGMEIGYGRAWRAPGRRQIATVTIGYADGIPRSYGNGRAWVLIRGRRYPVVGRVCMDQLLADVTDEEDLEETGILDWDDWEEEDGARDAVRAGDVVTLIGRDGEEEIRAEEAAGWCDTITNELLCRMGGRLKRFMVGDKGDAEGGACEEACL